MLPESDRTNNKIQSGKRIIETYAKGGKAEEKKIRNSVGEGGGFTGKRRQTYNFIWPVG